MQELIKLGLQQWAGALAAEGLTNMSAFCMVEGEDDLPASMPRLAKRQLVKRAGELSAQRATLITVHFKVVTEGRSFDLELSAQETLSMVRARFPVDIPRPNKVCFEGVNLEDADILSRSNVVQGSVLHVIPVSGGPMNIYVKTPSGSVANISAPACTPLGVFELSVANARRCHVSQVQLSFNGMPLHDKNITLAGLGVTDGAIFKSATEMGSERSDK